MYQTGTIQYIPIASFKVAPKLRPGVGFVDWVMSKLVHPSKPVREQSTDRAKNQNLEGGVLVEEENKVVRRFQQIFFETLRIPT
jgi:hypothetical protein